MFAALNIGALAPFSLYVLCCHALYQTSLTRPNSIIPETKGRSLEEMDIIFGAVSAEARAENIARQEQGASRPFVTLCSALTWNRNDRIPRRQDRHWFCGLGVM
jgi:hypothetical protein